MAFKTLITTLLAVFFAAFAPVSFAAEPPGPLTPAALHSAYGLPRTASRAQTVAVIVAYDDPTLGRDLQTFGTQFSLPACTEASGCLRRVNQRGQASPLPPPDPTGGNWTTEAALGTQTVHGICQNCHLLVVEADSEAKADLAAAVDTAVRLGAREIATSYIFSESLLDGQYAPDYDHPGVVITAASGDTGFAFGTNVPASYPGVVAVGGTTLRLGRTGQRAGETVWKSSDGVGASGCSLFTAAPSWQAAYAQQAGCAGKRAVADVAAAAGPGAPLYSSTPLTASGEKGWFEADGTSLSSPIIAGTFALAGGIGPGQSAAAILYSHLSTPGAFHDIATGANGSCSGAAICQVRHGYDGPTGVGTPNGLAGFLSGSASSPRAKLVGGTAFVFPSHVSEIVLGCAGRVACRGSLTLVAGRTLLAPQQSFTIAAEGGAVVRPVLNRASVQLLERASHLRLKVTLKIQGSGFRSTSTPLTLVGLARLTGGLVTGDTAFVSSTGVVGLPVACLASRACNGGASLESGRTIVARSHQVTVAAKNASIVPLSLTVAGLRLFAGRDELSVRLVLGQSGAKPAASTLHLVGLT